MAGLFLSSLQPPSSRTPHPVPSKSEVSFLISLFFYFSVSPFEFQRKPVTLMYHTGTGQDGIDGMGWDGIGWRRESFGAKSFLALLLSLCCSLLAVMFLHTFDAF